MNAISNNQLAKRICPHRGIGLENTIPAIVTAVEQAPFLVEFDVQYSDGQLYLGHPPVINMDARLGDALRLFQNSSTIPKVDIKLDPQTWRTALDYLITQLNAYGPQQVLLNIDGRLDAPNYFEAESILMQRTDDNVLLNIDLARYVGQGEQAISDHLGTLHRSPFSISPNLASDINFSLDFAIANGIKQVHFWAFSQAKYSQADLIELMQQCLDRHLEVYFDIVAGNMMI